MGRDLAQAPGGAPPVLALPGGARRLSRGPARRHQGGQGRRVPGAPPEGHPTGRPQLSALRQHRWGQGHGALPARDAQAQRALGSDRGPHPGGAHARRSTAAAARLSPSRPALRTAARGSRWPCLPGHAWRPVAARRGDRGGCPGAPHGVAPGAASAWGTRWARGPRPHDAAGRGGAGACGPGGWTTAARSRASMPRSGLATVHGPRRGARTGGGRAGPPPRAAPPGPQTPGARGGLRGHPGPARGRQPGGGASRAGCPRARQPRALPVGPHVHVGLRGEASDAIPGGGGAGAPRWPGQGRALPQGQGRGGPGGVPAPPRARALLAGWGLSGETHQGPQWPPALPLPPGRSGRSVRLREGFPPSRLDYLRRQVPRQ